MADDLGIPPGPWLTPRQALLYVPCPTLGALGAWCRRHGIVRGNNYSIAKADIDRIRKARQRRPKRVLHPNTLANLRHQKAADTP